ncbi:hypothetical protein CJF30_00001472 [Rutstroemia sp. NJR-2017a BBW]|nr:hypothetical protein CJF30_00001472 [Rutstroemia sp. NJR-2017a BBW]
MSVRSVEADRKRPGLFWPREFAIASGGSLLMRLPPCALSVNCFAKSRLCAANASKGESSGGISPTRCSLGDGNARGDGSALLALLSCPWECDRRSMKAGLLLFGMFACGPEPLYQPQYIPSLAELVDMGRTYDVTGGTIAIPRSKFYCFQGIKRCGCRIDVE